MIQVDNLDSLRAWMPTVVAVVVNTVLLMAGGVKLFRMMEQKVDGVVQAVIGYQGKGGLLQTVEHQGAELDGLRKEFTAFTKSETDDRHEFRSELQGRLGQLEARIDTTIAETNRAVVAVLEQTQKALLETAKGRRSKGSEDQ